MYLIILVLSMFAGIVFAPIEEPTTLEWFSAILFIIGGLLAVLPLSFYVVSAFFNQFIIDEKNNVVSWVSEKDIGIDDEFIYVEQFYPFHNSFIF